MTLWSDIKNYFKHGGMLNKLIFINVGLYAIQVVAEALGYLISHDSFVANYWFRAPADLEQLLYRPWSVITYMFIHFDFWHILLNMLWLYIGGRAFANYLSEKKLLPVYLLGGLLGIAFYIASYNLFPVLIKDMKTAKALGASASVVAVLIAISAYQPNHTIYFRFIGGVKLKYIALVFILLDFVQFKNNTGGHIAHLGGAVFGLMYGLNMRKGKDIALGFERFLHKLFNSLPSFKRSKKSPLKTSYRKPKTDVEYREEKIKDQAKVDAILDKISKHGYDSLSKEEKDFLFKVGR